MIFSDFIKDGIVVFRLSEKIMSCYDAFPLMDRLKEFIDQGKKQFIMDFSKVPWMNSQGVAMIIWAVTSITNADGSIVFSGFSESADRILRITRLNTILSCYKDTESALGFFSNKT
jgi:anti-anti-sigma factor